jgi:hypothetical protein
MSTAWTLAAADVCTDALEHLGVIGAGEAASGDDMQVALRALDGVLKELPINGYVWPKLSAETALTWTAGQTIPLPADFFGAPVAWRLVDGKKVPLAQLPHARWIQMPDRAAAGTPTHFYVAPDNTIALWPVPETDPAVTLQYQRIVDDAEETVQPDVPQYMLNALGYGVAHECVLKFDTPPARAQTIAERWMSKRAAALEYAIESAPICFEVRD